MAVSEADGDFGTVGATGGDAGVAGGTTTVTILMAELPSRQRCDGGIWMAKVPSRPRWRGAGMTASEADSDFGMVGATGGDAGVDDSATAEQRW